MLNVFRAQSAELGLAPVPPTLPVQADPTSLALTRDMASARIIPGSVVVREISPDAGSVVIQPQAISNFMAAMTMRFKVKPRAELARLRPGDEINFQLHVAEKESWVGAMVKTGVMFPALAQKPALKAPCPACASAAGKQIYEQTRPGREPG